jgi:hypothetical protein
MEFEVPQFIEIEDKPFVFFTFKQFIFLVGGLGLGFIIWRLVVLMLGNSFLGLLPAIPVAVFVGALGFKIVHPKETFVETVEHAFRFFVKKKVFIWRKRNKTPEKGSRASGDLGTTDFTGLTPTLSGSKLKDMSWDLDTGSDSDSSAQIPR